MSKKPQKDRKISSATVNPGAKKTLQAPPEYPLVFSFFEKLFAIKHLGWILGGIYLVVMGILAFTYHRVGDYGVETDFFWSYVPEAKRFLEGQIRIEDFRGPLYPMALGVVGFVVGDFFNAGVLIALISASVAIALTYKLLADLFRPDVALVVVILLAFNPTFNQYSYSAGTDMFFNALVVASAWFIFSMREMNWLRLGLGALFAALAYLTRYNGLFAVIAVPVAILFVNFFKTVWKQRGIATAAFVVLFLAFITPWGIYSLQERGSFFYNKNYLNIAYTIYEKGETGWDQFWNEKKDEYTGLGDVIGRDPGKFIETIINNGINNFLYDLGLKDEADKQQDDLSLIHPLLGLLVLIGIVVNFFARPTRRQLAWYIYNVFFFGVLVLVFYGERFSLFLVPFYLTLAVYPLFAGSYAPAKWVRSPRIAAIAAVVLVIVTVRQTYAHNSTKISEGQQNILLIKDWFEKNVPPAEQTGSIAARKPHIAYYLDLKYISYPYVNTWDELKAELARQKVDYLFFSTFERYMRPQFQILIDPAKAPPGFTPLVKFGGPDAVLYKIEPEKF